jgi:CRISPR-associated protein Csm3
VVFDLNLVVNIFEEDDEKDILGMVFDGLELLQNDYLGGQGSRGYGQVRILVKDLTETVFDGDRTTERPLEYPVPEALRA